MSREFVVYHGAPSPKNIERAREVAPSLTHGAAWTPQKMTPHDWPYFIDSGAYHEYANDEYLWDPRDYFATLDKAASMPRDPDFIVLPDYVGDWSVTVERSFHFPYRSGRQPPTQETYRAAQDGMHRNYFQRVQQYDYPYYLAAQPDASATRVVRAATRHDCAGVFLGGPEAYKHRVGEELVQAAHTADLKAHVGSPPSLAWAFRLGFDSADTSRIVQRQLWGRLRRVDEMNTGGIQHRQRRLTGGWF